MQSELALYFERSLPWHLCLRFMELTQKPLGETPTQLLAALANLNSSLYLLYRPHFTRVHYLHSLKKTVDYIYNSCFLVQSQPKILNGEYNQQFIRVYILLWGAQLSDEIYTLNPTLENKFERSDELFDAIQELCLICQFMTVGSFMEAMQELCNVLKKDNITPRFHKRLINIFKELQIESTTILQGLDPNKSIQVKIQHPEPSPIKTLVRSICASNSGSKSPSSQKQSEKNTPSSCRSSDFKVPRQNQHIFKGRTIYSVHPMKYVKKSSKERVPKVIQYYESESMLNKVA